MSYAINVYIHTDNTKPYSEWEDELKRKHKLQFAKLNRQIDRLNLSGEALRHDPLSDCGVNGISKLKVRGNPQLRPLLCKVYGDNYHVNTEDYFYVFLVGAYEVSWQYVPSNAREMALSYKANLLEDIINRKEDHVRFRKETDQRV